MAFMAYRGIDILAVQETRCQSALPDGDLFGFTILSSPADSGGHHGVALLLGPRVRVNGSSTVVEHRCIAADVSVKISPKLQSHARVYAAYFPQRSAAAHQAEFTGTLAADVRRHPATTDENVIILADANGAAADLCGTTALTDAAPHAGNVKWTWASPTGRTKSTIDHILVSESHARTVRRVTYEQPLPSDHRLLSAVLAPKWSAPSIAETNRLHLHDLAWDGLARKEFNALYSSPSVRNIDTIAAAVRAVSGNWSTQTCLVQAPWSSPNAPLQDAVLDGANPLAESALESACHARAAAEASYYAEQLRNNPWHAWRHIDALVRKPPRIRGATSVKRLAEFFRQSMSSPPTSSSTTFHTPGADTVHISDSPFTAAEFEHVIATSSNHTAPGPEGLPIEAFRCPRVQADALQAINAYMLSDALPDSLITGTVCPQYKSKGDATDPANYRPIVLLPTLLKLIHKLLLVRIRAALDPLLLPNQAAYREAHNVTMNLLALHELKERARTTNIPLYCAFVDFTAAFDSIDRQLLFALCRSWNIPEKFVTFLERSHAQQKLYVRFDGLTDPTYISPVKGVMQGDTLAPYLFILVIDQILRQLPYDAGALAETTIPFLLRCCALAYADDIVLLAHSLPDAQRLLTALETAANSYGLRLNVKKGKTELLLVCHPSLRPSLPTALHCKAGAVNITRQYKYLGMLISDDPRNDWRTDFASRTKNAWYTIKKYDRIWRAPLVDPLLKRTLFRALVIPVLTYAAFTYPFTCSALTTLHVTTNKLLRYCLGHPILWDDIPAHTHSEELYSAFPFTPALVTHQLLTQWGHWARRVNYCPNPHPVLTVVCGTVHRAQPLRGPRAHPPSQSLSLASGLDKTALATTPAEMSKARWKSFVRKRTTQMAQDFATCVVQARRLVGEGCSDYVDWPSLIQRWYRKHK
jgi:hypothetical protein